MNSFAGKHCLKLFIIAACAFFLTSASSMGSQPRKYPLPQNLTVSIRPVEPINFNKPVKVKVIFNSAIGTTRNIEASFYTSENLSVDPASTKIAALNENESGETIVILKRKNPRSAKGEKWFQVSYGHMPDYPMVIERVRSDTASYPDREMKSRLLKTLSAYNEEKRTLRSSLTYDFQ